jgi:hypothetical protein
MEAVCARMLMLGSDGVGIADAIGRSPARPSTPRWRRTGSRTSGMSWRTRMTPAPGKDGAGAVGQ